MRVVATAVHLATGTAMPRPQPATGFYAWRVEPHWLEIVRRPLPVSGAAPRLRGPHAGANERHPRGPARRRRLRDQRVRARGRLRPDIVVLTGDLDELPRARVRADGARYTNSSRRAGWRRSGILGNHDYGSGWSHPEIADRVVAIATTRAASPCFATRCTTSTGCRLSASTICGRNASIRHAALASCDNRRPAIALSHNPDTVDFPGWDRFQGWILSGHTHGGQCKPPFLPPPLLPVRNRRYTQGAFRLSGNRAMYISRGVGHLHRRAGSTSGRKYGVRAAQA